MLPFQSFGGNPRRDNDTVASVPDAGTAVKTKELIHILSLELIPLGALFFVAP